MAELGSKRFKIGELDLKGLLEVMEWELTPLKVLAWTTIYDIQDSENNHRR